MNNRSFIINKEYDPLILQTILKRNWWIPLFLMTVFGLVAFLYLRYTKPIYESSMVIQLSDQDDAKEVINFENINSKENDLSATIELMRSQLMFEKAVQQINYNVSLFSKGQVLTEEKYNSSSFNVHPYQLKDSSLAGRPVWVDYNNGKVTLSYTFRSKNYSVTGKLNEHIENEHFDVIVKSPNVASFKNESSENQLYFIFNSLQSFASKLQSNLQIFPLDPVAKTVQISFRGNNPQLCHDVVQAVSNAFLIYDDDVQRKGSEKILGFIDRQLDSLVVELRSSKDSLMDFQRRSNMPDPENISSSINSNLDELQDQLFTTEDEIRSLNQIDQKLKSDPNRLEVYRLLPEMLGKSYESALSSHIMQLHELLEKKDDLLFRVTDENAEIKALNKRIDVKLSFVRKSISTILERLYTNTKLIRNEIAELESEYYDLPEKKMEFGRLKSIQDLNEKYFGLLTEKKVLYSISDAGYSSSNRVLSRPAVNATPVSPNRNLVYGSYIFIGLFLGFSILFLRYLTFNEINQVEDLKKLLPAKATILGGLPLIKNSMDFSQLMVGDAPKSILSESLRRIRTNLNYIHPYYKTIAISSSISGEGKTFVALNLAGIIAMSGKKTIVLYLDMRKPKIHLGLNANNTNGMSKLIVGQCTLEESIQKSKVENLDFITAGPIPPNPSELLLSKRFKEIVEELKTSYDVIIIDNPPIGLVSDGVRNLTEADIPIYVFKSHYSKRNFAQRVRELFEMKQLDSLNVILNGVQGFKKGTYGYGYGYGYYEEDFELSFFQRMLKFFRIRK